MEELHSTEALDREILEDARKKAFKILKSADDSIASSKASWDKKLARGEKKSRAGYAEKEGQFQREIMARLPMDKRRIRSEVINTLLNKAMEDFLASLPRAALLRIMEKELEKRKNEIAINQKEKASLRYRKLSKEECSALAGAFFPETSFTYSEDPLYMIAGSFPAIVIDFSQVRITISVDRAAEALLLEKRAELAEALLGTIEDLTPEMTAILGTGAGNG